MYSWYLHHRPTLQSEQLYQWGVGCLDLPICHHSRPVWTCSSKLWLPTCLLAKYRVFSPRQETKDAKDQSQACMWAEPICFDLLRPDLRTSTATCPQLHSHTSFYDRKSTANPKWGRQLSHVLTAIFLASSYSEVHAVRCHLTNSLCSSVPWTRQALWCPPNSIRKLIVFWSSGHLKRGLGRRTASSLFQ